MSLGLYSLGYPSLGLMYGAPRTDYGFALFDYKPNWQEPVREVLYYYTDIIVSQNQKQQRRGLRSLPRRQFVYSVLETGERAFALESLLYGSAGITYAMPVWTDGAFSDAEVTPADNMMSIDTGGLGFSTGGYALIYADHQQYEFARITDISSTSLTFVETFFYTWPPGTQVYPVIFVKVLDESRMEWFDGDTFSAQIVLEQVGVDGSHNLPQETAPVLYEGLEVITDMPDWSGDMGQVVQFGDIAIDNQIGDRAWTQFKQHATLRIGHQRFVDGRNQMMDLRALMQRLRGRLTPVWVPTPRRDLQPTGNVGATDTSMTFRGSHHPVYVGSGKGRQHIMFRMRNGDVYMREVLAFSVSSGNTTMTMNAALGIAFTPDDVHQVSWLCKCHLAADQVTIEWHWQHPVFARCQLYFEGLI